MPSYFSRRRAGAGAGAQSALQELVLVGGGHAHVQVLRRFMMSPLPGIRLTLVLDGPGAVYSGMTPGLVAGDYSAHDVTIDCVPLARRAGARVVLAAARGLDPDARELLLEGRPPLAYDVLSFNVGASVRGLELPGVRAHALSTRPIAHFVRALNDALVRVQERTRGASAPHGARIVVVGAGVAAVELAFVLEARLRTAGLRPELTLLGDVEPPASVCPALRRKTHALLAARGIAVRRGEAARVFAAGVQLVDGTKLDAELVVWATGAAMPPLHRHLGLPLDAEGFLRVNSALQSVSHPEVFAAGDCAVIEGCKTPRAGVYAVRQGPVLADNLRAFLSDRRLRRYRPQRDFLKLINLGCGAALGEKWGVVLSGPAVFRLKDAIDRRFVRRFQTLDAQGADAPGVPTPEAMGMAPMDCGGCAAKLGPGELARVLSRLPAPPADPSVILGLTPPDDAAALWLAGQPGYAATAQAGDATNPTSENTAAPQPGASPPRDAMTSAKHGPAHPPAEPPPRDATTSANENTAALQPAATPPPTSDSPPRNAPSAPSGMLMLASIDGFRAFCDDPWLVGRAAALNAVSDLDAVGFAPRYALAWVTVPEGRSAEETCFQAMAGVRRELDALGVTLLGGHSTIGPELALGLAVFGAYHVGAPGAASPGLQGAAPAAPCLLRKGALCAGDVLVLTRALGTGVLLAADMQGRLPGDKLAALHAAMLTSNAPAARLAVQHGVCAATDVSGFGLAVHLGEMLQASGLAACLFPQRLPALPFARRLLARGLRSTLHPVNQAAAAKLLAGEGAASACDTSINDLQAGDPQAALLFDPQTCGGLLLGVPPARVQALVEALRQGGAGAAAVIGRVTTRTKGAPLLRLENPT